MFKVFVIVFLFFLVPTHSKTRGKNCETIFEFYGINKNIKAYKGWMRVCTNDKLELYSNKDLGPYDKKVICECFDDEYKTRDIDITR